MSLIFVGMGGLLMLLFITQLTIPWMRDTLIFPLFRRKVQHDNDFIATAVSDHVQQMRAEQEVSTGVDKVVAAYELDQFTSKLDELVEKNKNESV